MNEKTKKWLMIAGLAAVCIGLVFGISRILYREPEHAVQVAETEPEDTETVIDMSIADVQPENNGIQDDKLVIEAEKGMPGSETKQELQKKPEKTEKEKPQEPPAESEDTDTANAGAAADSKKTEKKDTNSQPENDTPSHGDTKDGMIYVVGFGWKSNEGGGGNGSEAGDVYENGNKIGSKD